MVYYYPFAYTILIQPYVEGCDTDDFRGQRAGFRVEGKGFRGLGFRVMGQCDSGVSV